MTDAFIHSNLQCIHSFFFISECIPCILPVLVVLEEIPLFHVKQFEYPEKRYLNENNYYYNNNIIIIIGCQLTKVLCC